MIQTFMHLSSLIIIHFLVKWFIKESWKNLMISPREAACLVLSRVLKPLKYECVRTLILYSNQVSNNVIELNKNHTLY